jgi:putative ABC transport system permease protein
MLKNYLKIAWRNLIKQKTFSFINISGLAIGVASCLIIYLYIHSELNYDQDAVDRSRTRRITASIVSPETETKLAITPAVLATTLQRELPEVETTLRVMQMSPVVKMKGDVFKETDFVKTDPSVFHVFRFQFLEGSATGALEKPNSIVLSEEVANKYFGVTPALGKTLVIDGQNWLVTAVVNNRPSNSDLTMRAIMTPDFEKDKTWVGDLNYYTFVVFRQKPNLSLLARKLEEFGKKYAKPEMVNAGAPDYNLTLQSEPLSEVHFSQGKEGDTQKGSRQTIYIFSILAVFILVIALLNYINLSTAKATERAKEVGIRKVSGAKRWQLIRQFLFESFLIMLIACVIALGLLALMLPYVNTLLPTKLEVNWFEALGVTGIVFLISWLLAGLYPAFVLTSFKPIKVLKGNFRQSSQGLWLRKTVTITQFAIAAALILGTTVIYTQMKFIRNKDLGFNKDQLLAVYLPSDSIYDGSVHAFENELRNRPEVQGMTVGSRMTIEGLSIGSTSVENQGKKRQLMVNYFNVDTNFLPLFGIKLAEGRNFSGIYGTDKDEACIVNDAFMKTIGWKNGLGQFVDRGGPKKMRIIGVIRNFIYRSMHNPVEPLILVYNDNPFFKSTTVKIQPASLPLVQAIYKKYFPAQPFDYGFLDDMINKQYESDRTTMSLFKDFTILAILLSCLGLYGLVALIAAQRTKEIGIRKVLGATLMQLFTLMTKDFVILVGFGIIVALPVAGFLMHRWLGTYAFHINLYWWMFLVPIVFLMIITLITISKEVIKSAVQNPANVLKEN